MFMQNQFNNQKQEADEDKAPSNVERDGYTAEELGEASAYNDSTEMAQQMRRGDESQGDPNKRDVVGASNAATQEDNHPVPQYQSAESDLSKKR